MSIRTKENVSVRYYVMINKIKIEINVYDDVDVMFFVIIVDACSTHLLLNLERFLRLLCLMRMHLPYDLLDILTTNKPYQTS